MVSKGLKVGDTFIDGVSTYIVEEVLADGNYISKRIKPRRAVKTEEPAEKKTRTRKSAE